LKDEYGIEPAATVVVSGGGDGAAEEFKQNSQLY
jgi:hypothetical protein